jgi:carotenoid cleavage dioxygenase
VVLDASDLTKDAVARVKLPQRVPYGFHGSWIADSE